MRMSYFLLVFLLLVFYLGQTQADASALNGRWQLDADNSEDLDDSGRAFNKKQEREKRLKSKQKFNKDNLGGSRNKYQNAANAAEKFIDDDYRTQSWDVTDEVREMVEAKTLKVYVANKVVLLYGPDRKRLLTLNPGGRVYSVRGMEFTDDAVGRALTYINGDDVVVETEMTIGGKLVERFSSNAEDDAMVLTIRLQETSGGPWLEFKRRYTRSHGS